MTTNQALTLDHLHAALTLPDFPTQDAWAQMRLDPPSPRAKPPADDSFRRAGVLVLVYPVDDTLTTVLMRRTPDPGVHSGQISFPGGSAEPFDASIEVTALREACEEVGVCETTLTVKGQLTVIGQLSPVYIQPSNFMVWPVVATLDRQPRFIPNPEEVAALFELPLTDLLDEACKKTTQMMLGDSGRLASRPYTVPYYDVEGQVVWGATALMLSELEARLRVVVE